MAYPIRMTFEDLRSLAAADVDAGFTPIGDPLANPARILWVQNLTDATLAFSVDGENDHFVLPTMGFVIIDATTNQAHTQGAFFPVGMSVYVTEVGTPTTGDVYVSVVYATSKENV